MCFSDIGLWDDGRVTDITGRIVPYHRRQDEVASRPKLRRSFCRYAKGAGIRRRHRRDGDRVEVRRPRNRSVGGPRRSEIAKHAHRLASRACRSMSGRRHRGCPEPPRACGVSGTAWPIKLSIIRRSGKYLLAERATCFVRSDEEKRNNGHDNPSRAVHNPKADDDRGG